MDQSSQGELSKSRNSEPWQFAHSNGTIAIPNVVWTFPSNSRSLLFLLSSSRQIWRKGVCIGEIFPIVSIHNLVNRWKLVVYSDDSRTRYGQREKPNSLKSWANEFLLLSLAKREPRSLAFSRDREGASLALFRIHSWQAISYFEIVREAGNKTHDFFLNVFLILWLQRSKVFLLSATVTDNLLLSYFFFSLTLVSDVDPTV